MILEVLKTLQARLMAAGIHVGPTPLARVTLGLQDPDEYQAAPLAVGIDFDNTIRAAGDRGRIGQRVVKDLNLATGHVAVLDPPQFVDHTLNVHLYMRETRAGDAIGVGYTLGEDFLDNQERLLGALGVVREIYYPVDVNGVSWGFTTRYEGNLSQVNGTLMYHAIYRYVANYPLTNGLTETELRVMVKYALLGEVGVQDPTPLDVPFPDPPERGRLFREE